VIVRPVITERSMATTEDKKYTFEVLPDSNKAEIKKAVEQIFGVKVASVNTLNVHPKGKRLGAGRPGKTKAWKKAIVQLTEDSRAIEFFEGMV
jgi:large subunit ribosomal protein L23